MGLNPFILLARLAGLFLAEEVGAAPALDDKDALDLVRLGLAEESSDGAKCDEGSEADGLAAIAVISSSESAFGSSITMSAKAAGLLEVRRVRPTAGVTTGSSLPAC